MAITNTSANPRFDWLGGANPGAIEAQEAAGQKELVNSTQFPTDLGYDGKKEDYEALGFVFGHVNPKDPMFQDVQLPEGWYRGASDHSMWSYIYDTEDRRRVAIFYKAAFYDRSANAGLLSEASQVTEAQSKTSNDVYDDMRYPQWRHGRDKRDGENIVQEYSECKLDEKGDIIVERPDGDVGYAMTGVRTTVTIAPDGTIVSTVTITDGPTFESIR